MPLNVRHYSKPSLRAYRQAASYVPADHPDRVSDYAYDKWLLWLMSLSL